MSKKSNADHTITSFPSSRVATFDVGEIGRNKHHITALLEVNVTKAKQQLRELRKAGTDIGLFSWIVSVIGKTVAEHPYIHAINYRRNRQVQFKDVSISMPVEKDINGTKVPLALLIDKVNSMSAIEVQNYISSAVNESVDGAKDYVLGSGKGKKSNALFFRMPRFIRLFIWKILLRNPFRRQKMMGTAVVTNIGTSGSFPGWMIPKSLHNLVFGVGTIVKKPVVSKGEVVAGDVLHLTVMFDHDVVDGVPAAKFAQKLVRNLEQGL